MRRKPVGSKWYARLLLYLILVAGAVAFMVPFFWMISVSIKNPGNLAKYPIEFWPAKPEWNNYLEVWRRADVPRYMLNSTFLSTMTAFLTVITSSLAAYGFARHRVRIKNFFFTIVLATMMIPGMVTMIPQFVIFYRLGFLNTYWPWVVWGLSTNGFLIFLMRQFFSTIPMELEDAATIDGCSRVRTFFAIFLPISKPALAASFIFCFSWWWGDYLTPSLYLQGNMVPFSVALIRGLNPPFRPDFAPDTPVQMAGALYFLTPLIVIFFLAQKYITQGIVTTGLKG
ncbi:MAG: carbohydrate ABC transporter permease [Patescibacteria group bacterium]